MSYSGSEFVVTSGPVAILLFFLISDHLLFAPLNSLDFFYQRTHLLGIQPLDINNHCVNDSDLFKEVDLLLRLQKSNFFGKLCQLLELKT